MGVRPRLVHTVCSAFVIAFHIIKAPFAHSFHWLGVRFLSGFATLAVHSLLAPCSVLLSSHYTLLCTIDRFGASVCRCRCHPGVVIFAVAITCSCGRHPPVPTCVVRDVVLEYR